MKKSIYKTGLYATLTVAVIALSACADKGSKTSEDDPTVDAQTAVEQQATGVDDNMANMSADEMANMPTDDVAVASASDATTTTDNDVVVASADDDITVEGVNDAQIMDGTEQEEHISTY